jgi:hypothetical protein
MTDPEAPSDPNHQPEVVELAERERSLGRLEGEDENLLRVWYDGHALSDQRYVNKDLLAIVSLAMRDAAFRQRLVDDPRGMIDALPSDVQLPTVDLVFHENTDETLHVVLPPRAGDLTFRPAELRGFLSSRTDEIVTRAGEFGVGGANWYDVGDVFADRIFGNTPDHGDR